jgi:outer membrane receptor protein involved in Fe transport
MKRFYTLSLVILCLFTSVIGESQRSGQGQWQNAQISIKGKIIDSESSEPLEFAAVSLYSTRDSSLISGGVSDENGFIDIKSRPGNMHVKIEYISYETYWVENVSISDDQGAYDLGEIALNMSGALLEEIEVKTQKSDFQLGLDKKVFNVEKDMITRGGNASDILDNIPSVSVDLEGNVSLRGSDNVRILVDGKPSGLVGLNGNDALRSLDGNMIDKVEVITNPSARYDAEGMAGIINIILKKDQKKGINGSFSATIGHPDNFGGSANINFRRNHINLFTNYGINYRKSPGTGSLYQEYYLGDTTTYLDQTRERTRERLSHNIRFGMDYFFNEKNILTGAFLYRISDGESNTSVIYNDLNYLKNLATITTRDEIEESDRPNLEYSLDFRRIFETKGHELTASVKFEKSTDNETSDYLERVFNPDMSLRGIADIDQRSTTDEGDKSWLAQVDYILPTSKDGKLEAGYKGSFKNIDNDYLVEEYADGQWQRMDALSNDFNYNEDIHAAYLIYGNKVRNFSYQVGLRTEYSDVITELVQTGEENARDYFDLFPSAHLGYEFLGQNTLQVSYSRRVRRPRFHYLNPFFTFSDSRNFYSGNPNLDPEYTHSVELGHVKYWDKSSLTSSMYYRYTSGVIQRIRTIDDEGITRTSPQNLATRNSYGLEFTFSKELMKNWKMNGNMNFFRAITDGGNLGEEYEADDYSWMGRLSSKVTVFKEVDAQLRFNYRGPMENTQGRSKSSYFLDFGISRDIFQKKATLTLNVSDIFNTRKRRYETYGDRFYSEGEFQWRPRQTRLTLSYRLNQKKKRDRGNRNGQEFEGEDMEFQGGGK